MSKSSNLLKKSASCVEVEGVTSASAHGTAQKTSVPVRDPVTEVGTSEVDPELEDEELKTGKLLSQDLSAKDNANLVNVTASEGNEEVVAVDALLEVPCKWMPGNPELGCEPIRPVSDASEKANSSKKQMSHGILLKRAGGQNRIEDAEKSAEPSVALDPDANSRAFLGRPVPVAWLVEFLRDFA